MCSGLLPGDTDFYTEKCYNYKTDIVIMLLTNGEVKKYVFV